MKNAYKHAFASPQYFLKCSSFCESVQNRPFLTFSSNPLSCWNSIFLGTFFLFPWCLDETFRPAILWHHQDLNGVSGENRLLCSCYSPASWSSPASQWRMFGSVGPFCFPENWLQLVWKIPKLLFLLYSFVAQG